MSVPAIKKIMNYLWGEGEEAEEQNYAEDYNQVDYDYDEDESESTGETLSLFKRKNREKVVAMSQQQIKMKISKPTNFDQVDEIIIELKQKNAVVINLEYVSKDVARRIVDVVSGATKAIDGHMEKVSNSIFVVAPFNYDIVNEITKEKIESKFSASWIK